MTEAVTLAIRERLERVRDERKRDNSGRRKQSSVAKRKSSRYYARSALKLPNYSKDRR